MTTASSGSRLVAALLPREPTQNDQQAAGSEGLSLPGLEEQTVRLSIHDASRLEWSVTVPVPERRELPYTIEVELELPGNAAAHQAPWLHLQSLTRLEGPTAHTVTGDGSVDALRRGAMGLTDFVGRAREGFQRHCEIVSTAQGAPPPFEHQPYEFLAGWLEAALMKVTEVRRKLVQPRADDAEMAACERRLVDEFVGVRLLEMIASCRNALDATTARSPEPSYDLSKAFQSLAERIGRAAADEIAYRRERGFVCAEVGSVESIEQYVERAAHLKKHFQTVLFLDRETVQADERVQKWLATFAAILAGALAFVLQLFLSSTTQISSGLLVLAILMGLSYAMRDRVKEAARAWLTGKAYRFHAQRVVYCRLPGRDTGSDVIAAREWCNHQTRTRADPLNPEAGASLSMTVVHYLHRGRVMANEALIGVGVRSVRHIFRYDMAGLFSRLENALKTVPAFDAKAGSVTFVEAPRRYKVPVQICAVIGGREHRRSGTLVLDRNGLRELI